MRLSDRLSVTFPGDGEILELKLNGGDAKEDTALLQAIIDAFLAAMQAPPESPADPNAAPDSADDAPGDLSQYASSAADNPAVLQPGDAVALIVAGAFPEAPARRRLCHRAGRNPGPGPTLRSRRRRRQDGGSKPKQPSKSISAKRSLTSPCELTLATNKTPAAAASEDGASSSPTFLYDGKTFDQWRDLLEARAQNRAPHRSDQRPGRLCPRRLRPGGGRRHARDRQPVRLSYDRRVR